MGGGTYSYVARETRATSLGYTDSSTPMDSIFKQNRERKIYVEMDPKHISLREARDSEDHPISFPVILGLDDTGSMGSIPRDLINTGIPTIMKGVQNAGKVDPSILFTAIGDHECDQAPLQVGQFESGDEQLDKWLSHTWIEGGGGNNSGESYCILHSFVADIVKTDHWDKRGQKGLLITIGDEPALPNYPGTAFAEWPFKTQGFSDAVAIKQAQKQWEVYHIVPAHGYNQTKGMKYWKSMLNERALFAKNNDEIISIIKELIVRHAPNPDTVYQKVEDEKRDDTTEIL